MQSLSFSIRKTPNDDTRSSAAGANGRLLRNSLRRAQADAKAEEKADAKADLLQQQPSVLPSSESPDRERSRKSLPIFEDFRPRPDGREVSYGSLRFPSSKRNPAKWVVVSATESDQAAAASGADKGSEKRQMEALHSLMIGCWALGPPSVLISIMGDASGKVKTMSEKHKLVFERGLLGAAKKTKAWVITGGTEGGASTLVGEICRKGELPCIGVVPWGATWYNSEMESQGNGRVIEYGAKEKGRGGPVPFQANKNRSSVLKIELIKARLAWSRPPPAPHTLCPLIPIADQGATHMEPPTPSAH